MHIWPQVVVAGYLLVYVLSSVYLDGKPREGNYKAWENIVAAIIYALVLWAGGFWHLRH
jgi:hypothetical protein